MNKSFEEYTVDHVLALFKQDHEAAKESLANMGTSCVCNIRTLLKTLEGYVLISSNPQSEKDAIIKLLKDTLIEAIHKPTGVNEIIEELGITNNNNNNNIH